MDCITCAVRQATEIISSSVDGAAAQEGAMREVLGTIARASFADSPPILGGDVHCVLRRWAGRDPFLEQKRRFNRIALAMLDSLRERVRLSHNPLRTAARIAIAGNIIDMSLVPDLDHATLDRTIDEAVNHPLAIDHMDDFENAARRARHIVYLGDNAGEIVFDRLLIEQLPHDRVTFVVRGGPIINDVTMEDAHEAGIAQMVHTIPNGAEVPGTIPGLCSDEFVDCFARADLVIAKGQGNYETLCDFDGTLPAPRPPHRPPTFFLLKAKCAVVARMLAVAPGSTVVLNRDRQPAAEESR